MHRTFNDLQVYQRSLKTVLWNCDILVRIRIRASDQWIRILWLQDACLLLFEGTFTSFSTIKSHKRVTKWQNSRNQRFSYYFCLMIERSGSVPLKNGFVSLSNGFGSGSRRPESHTDPTDLDPDPQHWLKHSCFMKWMFSSWHYSNKFFNCKIIIAEDTHNYGRLVLPDFIPHSGGFSMDNPEYILQVSRELASSLLQCF